MRQKRKNILEVEVRIFLEISHSLVYSRDLKWGPVGDQAEWFPINDPPRPVIDDILIMKLRPGQVRYALPLNN
jgi:hypothetical protein